jgi:hypothetical protein
VIDHLYEVVQLVEVSHWPSIVLITERSVYKMPSTEASVRAIWCSS